jgi:chemotaxis signal transduction protein
MSLQKDQGIRTYLSFKLSEEVFAINVSRVLNILEMSHITKIPKTPDYMKGVINLRGTVLPVVDLRVKFGLPEKDVSVDTSIVVLSVDIAGEQVNLGILVDSVREVLDIRNSEVSPSPAIGTKYDSTLIDGMWRTGDTFIMILDINKVFATDEIINIAEQVEIPDGESAESQ